MVNFSSSAFSLVLMASSSFLGLAQVAGDGYCTYDLECDGHAQGGTWCNEGKENCNECDGIWCATGNLVSDAKYYMAEEQPVVNENPSAELIGNEDVPVPSTSPDTVDKEDVDDSDEHRFIIKFKDSFPPNGRRRAKDMEPRALKEQFIMMLPEDNAEVAELATKGEVEYWEGRDDVEYVEKDTKVYLTAESVPFGINQVKALSVSDRFVSNRKVCVIDSGYDINHPDLPKGNRVTGKGVRQFKWFEDTIRHGTHVAGTIAAIGGNDRGVVGVNRNGNLKLHIVRVFGTEEEDEKWVWGSSILSAAEECQAAGANVINMSLGSYTPSRTARAGFERMYENGNILLVAAAGNGGNTRYSYPASYDSVVSVAAIDSRKRHASFSQRNNQVDIAAPGVSVRSTVPGGRYANFRGTSMASPHVAGVAALVWSHFPQKSAREIREALEKSAEDLGAPGRDDLYGYGLVRADLALQYLQNQGGSGGGNGGNGSGPGQPSDFLSYTSGAFPSMCLDLSRSNAENMNDIWLYRCNGTPAQKWKLDSNGFLRSQVNPSKCLVPTGRASNGSKIVIYDCSDRFAHMKWSRDSRGRFVLKSNGKCLDVAEQGATSSSKVLQIYNCNDRSDKIWNPESSGSDGSSGSIVDKFDFHPFLDSSGNDIKRASGNINAIASECFSNPRCAGFNSNGWMKHTLRNQSQWSRWTDDSTKGFYVKKAN